MRLNYRSSEKRMYFFFHVKLFLPSMDRDVVCMSRSFTRLKRCGFSRQSVGMARKADGARLGLRAS
jgi:hypothetical protein